MEYIVTIGIPIYNVQNYIGRALESALAQTFESIEFLIVDDCGTDLSITIIKDYQLSHPRGQHIRIVRQPHNMGIGEARNRMIDEAKGKYLYFMDGDDTIASNTIETLYNALVEHQAEICFGSYEQSWDFENNAKPFVYQYPKRVFYDNESFANYAFRKYDGIQTQSWNFLFEINLFRRNHLRFLPITFWEDMTMTLRLPAYVNKAVTLPDITYHYLCHYYSESNFQHRESIPKSEIETTANAIETVKQATAFLAQQSYYPGLFNKLMMTDFYIACTILHNKNIITPAFTNQEIHKFMRSPIPLSMVLKHKQKKLFNLFLYVLSIMPSSLSVFIIKLLGKRKGLI